MVNGKILKKLERRVYMNGGSSKLTDLMIGDVGSLTLGSIVQFNVQTSLMIR
jgi:hypothetical protein